jgi:hypothetical protein
MDVDGVLEFNAGSRHSKLGINWGMPLFRGTYILCVDLTHENRVILEATAVQTLNEVSMEDLEKFSIEDGPLTELFPFSSR